MPTFPNNVSPFSPLNNPLRNLARPLPKPDAFAYISFHLMLSIDFLSAFPIYSPSPSKSLILLLNADSVSSNWYRSSALAPPPAAPALPPLPESFLVSIVFNSSNARSPAFILSTFFAAFPVLPAISSAPDAALSKSLAIPEFDILIFHPKIFPSAFTTVCANEIMLDNAELSALTSGFNALIKAVPKTPASCFNCSFKILTWFAHVSAVRIKSPCAAVVFAMTYWYRSMVFSICDMDLMSASIPFFNAHSFSVAWVRSRPYFLSGSVSPVNTACNERATSSCSIL